MKIEPAAWDDADVQRLAADQQAEVRARYDGKGEPGTPPSAADISVVLVARADDGEALGCGALRALGDDAAEVKRMYVAPSARGRGVATALLAELEDAARERGLDDAAPGDRTAAARGDRPVLRRRLPADPGVRRLRRRTGRRGLPLLRAGARPSLSVGEAA